MTKGLQTKAATEKRSYEQERKNCYRLNVRENEVSQKWFTTAVAAVRNTKRRSKHLQLAITNNVKENQCVVIIPTYGMENQYHGSSSKEICLAPHTSNMDFLIGQLFAKAENMPSGFLMKREWFFWPLGPIWRRLGGIPVWRDKKSSMTDRLSEVARKADKFSLCITPEGTRSLNPDWKLGFYFIAQKAGIPILLYAVDYERKLIECTRMIEPTGDVEDDMKEIKLYFKNFKGKNPELFTTGDV